MFKRDEDLEFVEEHLQNSRVKKYIKGRTLGKGGFAECFQLVSQETGKRYAAKVIDKQSLAKGKTKEKLESEIVIHRSLHHPHIVKFEHYFEDHQFVYILLELCTNNTLNELLKRRKVLTESEVKYYLTQLLQALQYIHQHKVIHRDLKLGNFFLSDSLQLKVGDFGLATTLAYEGQRRKTMCGTPNYIAPQILQSKKGHSYEVDIWSTGVITYALLFGKPPFETNEVKLTYERIKVCDFSFPKLVVSQEARNFVSRMLMLNPANRATLHELMTHDFLAKQQIPKGLPLSTLACPPSKQFLQGLKSEGRAIRPYREELKNSKQHSKACREEDYEHNVNSSRTSKYFQKPNSLLPSEHLTLHPSKAQKSQRSQGSLPRNSASAALLPRKNTVLSSAPNSGSLQLVSFFQEQPKYGMFYVLSNGAMGMRFNDQTCLVSNSKFNKFRYFSLQGSRQRVVFAGGEEPEPLQKKMKILSHFGKVSKFEGKGELANPVNKLKEQLSAFVDSYYVTNHYTLFSFSSGLFQAKFKDRSELVLEQETVLFISRDRKRLLFKDFAALACQDEDLKIKYAHVATLVKKIRRAKAANSSAEEKNEKNQSEKDKNDKQDRNERQEGNERQDKEKEKIDKQDRHRNLNKEKENALVAQSNSHSRLSKPKELSLRKQFSSTASLHTKRPLCESNANRGRPDSSTGLLRQKEKVF